MRLEQLLRSLAWTFANEKKKYKSLRLITPRFADRSSLFAPHALSSLPLIANMFNLPVTTLALLLSAIGARAAVSATGRCGASFKGLTCAGSTFGSCCSSNSWWYASPNTTVLPDANKDKRFNVSILRNWLPVKTWKLRLVSRA
jgi:hypothetical protein